MYVFNRVVITVRAAPAVGEDASGILFCVFLNFFSGRRVDGGPALIAGAVLRCGTAGLLRRNRTLMLALRTHRGRLPFLGLASVRGLVLDGQPSKKTALARAAIMRVSRVDSVNVAYLERSFCHDSVAYMVTRARLKSMALPVDSSRESHKPGVAENFTMLTQSPARRKAVPLGRSQP